MPSPESKAQNSSQLNPETAGTTPAPQFDYKNDIGSLHDLMFNTPLDGRASPYMKNASVSGFSSDTIMQKSYNESIIWPFEAAFSTRRAVLVDDVSDYMVEGFETRGWGEPARQAVVIPIYIDNNELPSAIVVMGLNSRRPYDKDYSDWIDLTRLSLNSLLTAVKGREADAIRAEWVITSCLTCLAIYTLLSRPGIFLNSIGRRRHSLAMPLMSSVGLSNWFLRDSI